MENPASLNLRRKQEIVLVAEPEVVSSALVENLLANFYRVKIFSENIEGWNLISQPLLESSFLEIRSLEKLNGTDKYLQVFYVDHSFSSFNSEGIENFSNIQARRIIKTFNLLAETSSAAFFLFPHVQLPAFARATEQNFQKYIYSNNKKAVVLFSGQVFGPRMVLTERDLLSRIFKDALFKDTIRIPIDNPILYPVYVSDLVKKIVDVYIKDRTEGTSLRNINFQSFLLTPEAQPALEFAKEVSKLSGNKNIILENEVWQQETSKETNKIELKEFSSKNLSFCLRWMFENKDKLLIEEQKVVRQVKPKLKKSFSFHPKLVLKLPMFVRLPHLNIRFSRPLFLKKVKFHPKEVKVKIPAKKDSTFGFFNKKSKWRLGLIRVFAFLFWAIFIPSLFLVISLGLLFLGGKSLVGGKLAYSHYFFQAAKVSAVSSEVFFKAYEKVPFVGSPFGIVAKNAEISKKSAEIGMKFGKEVGSANELSRRIFGNEPYKVTDYTQGMALNLDVIYREISFIESEIKDMGDLETFYLKNLLTRVDLAQKREELVVSKNLIERLPWLLAEGGIRKYLVLFENNMELRPAGGFIGSFALVELDNGRLINLNIYDVYSADGQLQGHIEPPEPIKKYLNQANWYLRDSNWDPDFNVSAQRAEWFLDKEMDIAVDGVFSVDLELVKDFLSLSGPLELVDFNKKVDKDNLYELTQEEVEKIGRAHV
jgi:hypothetical protein